MKNYKLNEQELYSFLNKMNYDLLLVHLLRISYGTSNMDEIMERVELIKEKYPIASDIYIAREQFELMNNFPFINNTFIDILSELSTITVESAIFLGYYNE